jgi:maleamate amidohydrolase
MERRMEDYQNRGYGQIRIRFGEKTGIVVVDFQTAFTDPQYALGGAPLVMRAVENTAKFLEVARRYNVPVASCNDLTVCRKAPSTFFETGVSAYFVKERVDTVIVTGCNASGPIRATSIDSFRTIVPEDCVGDIEEQPHRNNLPDLGGRYVNFGDLAARLAYLEDWRKKNVH